FFLQNGEPRLPEAPYELHRGREARGADGVDASRSLLSGFDKACPIEDREVLGHRLLGYVDLGGDLTNGAPPLPQELEDRDAARLPERLHHDGRLDAALFHK